MTKKETMKRLIILSLISFSLFFSCRYNRIRTNEKELAKQILLQEKEKEEAVSIGSQKQLPDTLNRFSTSFRYKEDRSVDPSHLPIKIDIAGNLNNVKEIKLSDVNTYITYIRMEAPPDSAFRKDIGFKYHLSDDFIIAINPFGILHYTYNGKFINIIVKNDFTRMEVSPDGVMSYGDYTFKGAYNETVRSVGNKLYYSYLNNLTRQEYLMEYNCSEIQIGQTIKNDAENPSKIIGQGQIIVDYNHGKVNPGPTQMNQGGIWSASLDYFYKGNGTYWIDDNTYSKKLKGDNMLGIFNKKGDTLSTFTQHEKLVNYTNSIQRGTDWGIQYEFNDKIFFRNAFNDTVFLVIPPNRLQPAYVMNYGNYKVTRQQAVDPNFNLTGKIIPQSWAETKNYIYMTFTKDDYDCSISRKNKTVKIYRALYSKLSQQLSVIIGDPFNYSPEILENNIDGGLPIWPSSFEIGKHGEILMSIKGRQLKERVRSEQFKLSKAPEPKKSELRQLATSVSDYEEILMIVK